MVLPKPDRVTPADAKEFDLIWLSVKCTATANIIEDLRAFVGANTTIVCLPEWFLAVTPIVRDAFPNNHVENAIVGFLTSQL